MKKYLVIDGIMEGTKFNGYYSKGRYVNTDTVGQSYPEKNVAINNEFLIEYLINMQVSAIIENGNDNIGFVPFVKKQIEKENLNDKPLLYQGLNKLSESISEELRLYISKEVIKRVLEIINK